MTESVTNRQIFFIIILRIFAGSALELPLILAQKAGTGAWFVLLLGSIIFCIPVVIIVYLGNRFRGKTLFEYSKLLVGNFLTYIFVSIYIIYYLCIIALLTRSTAGIIKLEFLYKTPIAATMLVLLLVTGYAASKKLANLGRICGFLGLLVVISSITLHFIMFLEGDIRNIQPFFDLSETKTYFNALPATIFLYIGFEAIVIVPFTKTNGKKAIWVSILAVLSVGLLYIVMTETCFMMLGVEDVLSYKYPNVTAVRRLDIQILQFLKRLDFVLIISWVFAIFCSISFLIYTVTQFISKMFVKLNFNFIIVATCFFAFIIGLIPQTCEEVIQQHIKLTTYIGIFPLIIIPLILFVVAKVKKNVKEES